MVLGDCREDLEFFNRFYDKELIQSLEKVAGASFETLTYTEAVDLLKRSGESFEYPVEWGSDLQAEHERWLTEKKIQKPIGLIDYPRDIKPFYMRVNDDGRTVAAMDVLVPRVGEIIGGSQREERHGVLLEQMRLKGVNPEQYKWYLELREFGSVPHSGFGLGLERFVQFVTGLGNIRETIPFPRTPGSAEF
jgi:asparaginyl-tRNA synthetase